MRPSLAAVILACASGDKMRIRFNADNLAFVSGECLRPMLDSAFKHILYNKPLSKARYLSR